MIASGHQERHVPPRTITEPARQIPLYGEYEVVVLGGGPAGIAAAVAAARAGRRTLLIERYGFLGGMGTAAGVTNFCGLHANVYGEMHRVVQGIATELLARIDGLGGLNAPHLILGKILAQAYDTAAYKIAADDLLAHHKVDVLFHALGAGVAMHDTSRINATGTAAVATRTTAHGTAFSTATAKVGIARVGIATVAIATVGIVTADGAAAGIADADRGASSRTVGRRSPSSPMARRLAGLTSVAMVDTSAARRRAISPNQETPSSRCT